MRQSASLQATSYESGRRSRINYQGAVNARYYLEKFYNHPERRDYLPPCVTRKVTPDEVLFVGPYAAEMGDKVFIHASEFGLLRGVITRPMGGLMSMEIIADLNDREVLAARILWLDRIRTNSFIDHREYPRFRLPNPRSLFTLPGMPARDCHIVDISSSGAAVISEMQPDLKTRLILGRIHGEVVRHTEVGFAVNFDTPQNPSMLESLVAHPDGPGQLDRDIMVLDKSLQRPA